MVGVHGITGISMCSSSEADLLIGNGIEGKMAFGFSRWRRSTLVAAERGWVIGDGTLVNTEGVTDAILDKVSITAGSDCDIDIRGLVTINGFFHILRQFQSAE